MTMFVTASLKMPVGVAVKIIKGCPNASFEALRQLKNQLKRTVTPRCQGRKTP